MYNIWTIARRELQAIFVQPIAYIVAIAVTLITGFIFVAQISFTAQQPGSPPPNVNDILGTFTFLALFFMPLITMRLLAEEQQQGTMELLATMPLRDDELVIGKFLATFIFYLAIVALTLVYPLVILNFGNPDVGPIFTGYLATALVGAALIAIGLLSSALSNNQIVAAIIAFGITLALYLLSIPAQFLVENETLNTILSELAFADHQNSLFSGLITATDVLYYVLLTVVFLFATARVLESRRWR